MLPRLNPSLMDLPGLERGRVLTEASRYLDTPTFHITDARAAKSEGGAHDYYSNGDYWWPNPDTPDGLPYICRDGQSNPDNFTAHRLLLRRLRTETAALAAAWGLTGDERYAEKAVRLLREFFLDADTRMNPHLLYTQAIPGRCPGRGIGIIDTLHIVEAVPAILRLDTSASMTPKIGTGLRQWFADYLEWMTTHPYGIEEMQARNNHSVCWAVQAAAFALLTGNGEKADFCRDLYRNTLLPKQMREDGGFPEELRRTKPYAYSIFALDNMATLCQILSTPSENLWEFETPDGRGMRRGLAFLFPYLEDKRRWFLAPDIEHFDEWPVRQPSLLFGGMAFGEKKYLDLWARLNPDPRDAEVRRNVAVRQPVLWFTE